MAEHLAEAEEQQVEDPVGDIIERLPQDHSAQPWSELGVQQALALEVRPSDIFVTTAPKTGTTLLTQVLHQLRTGGDMEFEDIYQVVPWPPLCYDLGMDCGMEQKAFPRVFKTHQRLGAINAGGRYLCTIRNPARTVISWWNFLGPAGKNIPPLRKYSSVSEFARDRNFVVDGMRFGASLWEYYVEFWRCRHLDVVLVLVFEELVSNLRALLPRIAQFMGLGERYDGSAEAEAALDRVAAMCSQDFMLEHTAQFDESWCYTRLLELGRMREPETFCPAPRVTAGHSYALDQETLAFLEAQWAEKVTPHTGHTTYEEMAAELRLL